MRAGIITGLVLVVLAAGVSAAQAPRAGFLVNNVKDRPDVAPGDGICADKKGKCTLRAAIMEANALPGGDVIDLPGGLYTLTKPGAGEDAGATGDLDITEATTIFGVSSDKAIIDASLVNDRAMDYHATGGSSLLDVTLQNGTGSGGGGCLRVFNGSVTVTNAVLKNCSADVGGGVYVGTPGNLYLADTRVQNNSATRGGGIYAELTVLTLTGTTIAGNAATDGEGGGLYTDGTVFTFEGGSVNDNTATGPGGGAFIDGAGGQLEGVMFEGNQAGTDGGGIALVDAAVTISESTVSHSRARRHGGGIFSVQSDLTLTQTSVHDNSTVGTTSAQITRGGGLFLDRNDSILTNSTISGNSAVEGSAIYYGDGVFTSTLTHTTVTANRNDPFYAGATPFTAVHNAHAVSTPILRNSIISGNQGLLCAGPFQSEDGNVLGAVTDCALTTQSGDAVNVGDPLVQPLGYAGRSGHTAVHLPLAGSPALQNGNDAWCQTEDQIYMPRPNPIIDDCDSGSVEGVVPVLLVNGSFEDGDKNGQPDGWNTSGATSSFFKCDKPNRGKLFALTGRCAVRFTPGGGSISQTVTFPAPLAGFGLGMYADLKTNVEVKFVKLKFTLADSSKQKDSLAGKTTTNGYINLTNGFEFPGQPVTKVKIIVTFSGAAGKVLIDSMWLDATQDTRGGRIPLPPPAPAGFRGNN